MAWSVIDSPIGELLLRADGGALTGIDLPNAQGLAPRPGEAAGHDPVLDLAAAQLVEYFAGERTAFSLPLAGVGTPFQQRVWQALLAVPYGTTTSYGALARALGAPGAIRAVGRANGANPLPIVVPCHRVIGADGSLTGYAGGLELKRRLLALEGAVLPA